MNTLKAMYGPAWLAFPYVFAKAGYIGGLVLGILVGAVNCYSMLILSSVLDQHPTCHSYSELSFQIKGRRFKILTDVFICTLQLCLCSGYMFFIANMLEQIVCY